MSLIIDKVMVEIVKELESKYRKELDSYFPDLNINYSYYQYLLVIYLNKEISQNEVARQMNVLKSSVSKAVKVLSDKKLIIVYKDNRDVRSNILKASEKGVLVSKVYRKLIVKLNKEVFKDFNNDEIKEIKIILKKIYLNLNGFEYQGILKEII